MSIEKIVLTDADQEISHETYELSAQNGPKLSGASDWKVTKRTLVGGSSAGVEVVEIYNGELTISLLPTRGMGIWKVTSNETEFGWSSPIKRPVHPSNVNLVERDGLGWLSGFNEMMCRCGLAWHGAPEKDPETGDNRTLHGRISNLQAHYLDLEVSDENSGSLKVTGHVDEAMLFWPALQLRSTLETLPGSNSFTVTDVITNNGGTPQGIEMLYHTNFGTPLLEAGSKLLIPQEELSPRDEWAAKEIDKWDEYIAPEPGRAEQCYFVKPAADSNGNTSAMLRNSGGTLGAKLDFNVKELPWFTQWKNEQSIVDGYCTGLEPGTSFPNPHSFEREKGRVITLQPGQSHSITLGFNFFTDKETVAKAEHEVTSLQEHFLPKVYKTPTPNHTPS